MANFTDLSKGKLYQKLNTFGIVNNEQGVKEGRRRLLHWEGNWSSFLNTSTGNLRLVWLLTNQENRLNAEEINLLVY